MFSLSTHQVEFPSVAVGTTSIEVVEVASEHAAPIELTFVVTAPLHGGGRDFGVQLEHIVLAPEMRTTIRVLFCPRGYGHRMHVVRVIGTSAGIAFERTLTVLGDGAPPAPYSFMETALPFYSYESQRGTPAVEAGKEGQHFTLALSSVAHARAAAFGHGDDAPYLIVPTGTARGTAVALVDPGYVAMSSHMTGLPAAAVAFAFELQQVRSRSLSRTHCVIRDVPFRGTVLDCIRHMLGLQCSLGTSCSNLPRAATRPVHAQGEVLIDPATNFATVVVSHPDATAYYRDQFNRPVALVVDALEPEPGDGDTMFTVLTSGLQNTGDKLIVCPTITLRRTGQLQSSGARLNSADMRKVVTRILAAISE